MRSAIGRSHKPDNKTKKKKVETKGQNEIDMALYLGNDFAEDYQEQVKEWCFNYAVLYNK